MVTVYSQKKKSNHKLVSRWEYTLSFWVSGHCNHGRL